MVPWGEESEVQVPALSSSSDDASYRCDFCYSQFASAESCLQHELSHQENLIRIQCHQCSSEFDIVEDFLSHLSSCFNDSSYDSASPSTPDCRGSHSGRCLICSGCRKCFRFDETMVLGEFDFRCDGCRLDAEISSLVDREAAKYVCGPDLAVQESSDVDFKTDDSSEDESQSSGSSTSGLSEIARVEGAGRKSTRGGPDPQGYPCDVCGKRFTRQNSLTVHKRLHTGEKPYRCDRCGRAFSDNSNYNKHRKGHDVSSPTATSVSGSKRQSLVGKAHVTTSESAPVEKQPKLPQDLKKVHPCPTCRRSFVHFSSLVRHRKVLNH